MKSVAWVMVLVVFWMTQLELVSSRCTGLPRTTTLYVNDTGEYFKSLYYPEHPTAYYASLECEWLIQTVDLGHLVVIEFNRTDIQYSEPCNKSVVRVYDGVSQHISPMLLESCGPNTPSPITSTGQSMFVLFQIFVGSTFQGLVARVYQIPGPTTTTTTTTTNTTTTTPAPTTTTTTTTIAIPTTPVVLSTTAVPTTSAVPTTTTNPTATTNNKVYTLGAQMSITFECIIIIMGSIALVLLLTMCLIVCFHKFDQDRLAARISRLSANQRHSRVAPMDHKQNNPILPDPPVTKSPTSPTSPENKDSVLASKARTSKAFNTWRGAVPKNRIDEDTSESDDYPAPSKREGTRQPPKGSPSRWGSPWEPGAGRWF